MLGREAFTTVVSTFAWLIVSFKRAVESAKEGCRAKHCRHLPLMQGTAFSGVS